MNDCFEHKLLRLKEKYRGRLEELAARLGISFNQLSAVINKRKKPGNQIVAAVDLLCLLEFPDPESHRAHVVAALHELAEQYKTAIVRSTEKAGLEDEENQDRNGGQTDRKEGAA